MRVFSDWYFYGFSIGFSMALVAFFGISEKTLAGGVILGSFAALLSEVVVELKKWREERERAHEKSLAKTTTWSKKGLNG